MAGFTLPQNCKMIQVLPPQEGGGVLETNSINLSNVRVLYVVVNYHAVASGDAVNIVLWRDIVPPPTATVAVLAVPAKIWYNGDTNTSNVLVRQANGADYTTPGPVVTPQQVVFMLDPATLGLAINDEPYIYVDCTIANVGAGDYVQAMFIAEMRYQGESP